MCSYLLEKFLLLFIPCSDFENSPSGLKSVDFLEYHVMFEEESFFRPQYHRNDHRYNTPRKDFLIFE